MNIITLPYPPTTNHLFTGKERRRKSDHYKAWVEEAGKELLTQRPLPQIKGPVRIHMKFGRPDKRRRDLGNLEKAISDLLVTFQIIEDDCKIEKLILEWSPDVVGARVEITECAV